jgi:hypothetical protein
MNNDRKDPNQGEGDRASARRYDKHAREFVHEGKVPPAARDAKQYVEKDPEGAARAERTARRGPHGYMGVVEGIVAKGRSIFERVRARITAATRRR